MCVVLHVGGFVVQFHSSSTKKKMELGVFELQQKQQVSSFMTNHGHSISTDFSEETLLKGIVNVLDMIDAQAQTKKSTLGSLKAELQREVAVSASLQSSHNDLLIRRTKRQATDLLMKIEQKSSQQLATLQELQS